MKNKFIYIILATACILVAVFAVFFYLNQTDSTKKTEITNFEECAKANGGLVQETYPRRCKTPDGKVFVEELIPDQKEKIEPKDKNDENVEPAALLPALPELVGIADLHRGGKVADENALVNPNVTWSVIRVPWADIEPQKGAYDFSYIEEDIALAKKYNKKVRLTISGGGNAPEWVRKEVDTLEYVKPTQHGDGQQLTVPVLWNKKYQDAYAAVITKVAERFQSDIQAVSLCGFDQACGFALGPDETKPLWESKGYSIGTHLLTAKWGVDLYANLFKNSLLLFYYSETFGDFSVAQDAAEYAVEKYGAERVGLLNEGLNIKKAQVKKGFFYDYGAQGNAIGYQTLWNIFNDPQEVMGCEQFLNKAECLQEVFDKGVEGGAKFFEIYEVDILNMPEAIKYGVGKIVTI